MARRMRLLAAVGLVGLQEGARRCDGPDAAVISTYGDVLFVLPVHMLVAFAVITLVVFLVLSMTIRRGRRGFGIQKVVGFTSGQLVRQTVTTYLPVVVIGSTVGGIAGHLGV